MRTFLAIISGKLIGKLTRMLKVGGGSAAPGLYALKVDPDLVTKLASQIPYNIIITGTNGKTTTSRLIGHFAQASNKKVIRNTTGSNLERGIASALISAVHLPGVTLNVELGIWELDEAAFNLVAPKIKPGVVVFLNVSRDQLDRYGEMDTVIKKWQQTLSLLPKSTRVIINGDDANLQRLKEGFPGTFTSFGINEGKIKGEKSFSGKTAKLNFEANNIKAESLEKVSFVVTEGKLKHRVNLPLPGIYNVYNFLAAFTVAKIAGLSPDQTLESLKDFSSAFGRVEKFTITPPGCKAKTGYIFLIKNPVGATEVAKTVSANFQPGDRLILALNDNLADGTDISWIWDAGFENFSAISCNLPTYCSGTRSYDLALRLKYAGFESRNLHIQPDLRMCLEEAAKGLKGRLFILPTYTALLSLQKILASKGIKKHYWKES